MRRIEAFLLSRKSNWRREPGVSKNCFGQMVLGTVPSGRGFIDMN